LYLLYIEKLHVDHPYKKDSNVAAVTLQKLLYHAFIKGNLQLPLVVGNAPVPSIF
jgi:hypothetical protein